MVGIKLRLLLGLALGFAVQVPAFANEPLSAIEWLEKRPKQIVVPLETPRIAIDEPAVAGSVTTPEVTVTPLGAPVRAAAGLLPSSVTGLPRDLWQGSDAEVVSTLITALNAEKLPALQALLFTLLLAEAGPPSDAQASEFLRARLQKLLSLGALDPAAALLMRADPAHPDLFDLYFDVSLLSGDPDAPCKALKAQPSLSRDFAPRIFCDVQLKDWDNAALTLSTADAIGALEPTDVALLERFLDPELFEQTPPAPQSLSVLQFRLFEAAGESLPTTALPRAFAATDLSGDAGWKPQLHAAERLARVGSISENRLLGIYTSRIPSASGGIWDRIEAVQRLDIALKSGDPVDILKQLRRSWEKMKEVQLEVPFATLFAQDLLRLPSQGADADLITKIALLSPMYEQAAKRRTEDVTLIMAQSIAIGEPKAQSALPLSQTLTDSFSGAGAPQKLTDMAGNARLGEAILRAIALTMSGAEGDPAALQNGLAFLRGIGLEDTVRRAAIQLILLEQGL
ncbi:MAG: hypothetical protein P8P65_14790 [Planktotalea sp.]|uniref:hypothetical protein n=1 Tax=Planktotalea sp. TaxID=2029877 RepID=UPI002634DF64|nr:hypothetical protein [Planktotalea sp.]MDG1077892.1 hypothetical protein [Planktotalea sp.]